jgi:hypothetical protein
MLTDHEESDVNVRAIFAFGLGLLAVGLVVYLAVWLLFGFFDRRLATGSPEFPLAIGHEARQPPEPRLQVTPREDLDALRAQQRDRLESYQWVDRTAGTVRIPISEAMKLAVQRGLPTRAVPGEKPK